MKHPLPAVDPRLVANTRVLTDDDMGKIAKDVLGDEEQGEPEKRRKRGRPAQWSYVLKTGGHVSARTISMAKGKREEFQEKKRAKAARQGRRGRPPGSKTPAASKRRRKESGAC